MGLKIPPFTIEQMGNASDEFYEVMGRFLSRREVVDELGGPVWDDDDKAWLIARSADGEVFGFLAVQAKGRATWVRSFYVLPDARRETIGAALVQRALDLWPGDIKVTATASSSRLFATYGFSETGTKGSYTTMERRANDNEDDPEDTDDDGD